MIDFFGVGVGGREFWLGVGHTVDVRYRRRVGREASEGKVIKSREATGVGSLFLCSFSFFPFVFGLVFPVPSPTPSFHMFYKSITTPASLFRLVAVEILPARRSPAEAPNPNSSPALSRTGSNEGRNRLDGAWVLVISLCFLSLFTFQPSDHPELVLCFHITTGPGIPSFFSPLDDDKTRAPATPSPIKGGGGKEKHTAHRHQRQEEKEGVPTSITHKQLPDDTPPSQPLAHAPAPSPRHRRRPAPRDKGTGGGG